MWGRKCSLFPEHLISVRDFTHSYTLQNLSIFGLCFWINDWFVCMVYIVLLLCHGLILFTPNSYQFMVGHGKISQLASTKDSSYKINCDNFSGNLWCNFVHISIGCHCSYYRYYVLKLNYQQHCEHHVKYVANFKIPSNVVRLFTKNGQMDLFGCTCCFAAAGAVGPGSGDIATPPSVCPSSVRPSVRPYVRPSVRPSGTLSFRTVTQKRIAVFSWNFAGTCTKSWGCAV